MLISLLLFSCKNSPIENNVFKYNIIKPENGIYAVVKKNVTEKELVDSYYEKLTYDNYKLTKIERYNPGNKLTDNLSTPAITKFEYNSDKQIKYVKYFDSDHNNAVDNKFGFWSIEYIYDEFNRVRMEIYRDEDNKFLSVPRDNLGKIAKKDFLAPVLTYEYLGDKLRIKALDQNFNLLKEVLGDKPCVPFIDCGEYE